MRAEKRPNARMLPHKPGKWPAAPSTARDGVTRIATSYPKQSCLRQTEGRIVATVAVGGKPVLATIDTGATRSLISKKIAECLKVGPTRRVFKKVVMGDGRPRAVTEALEAVVQIGDREHSCEPHIRPLKERKIH
ncbi:unnamed protein product [Ceratitis capitata]|uniref:(Mediterranean fruit fly) hypothetical protein n=1 Tax=Ceratitis capitata TaxID=7213 RepID=A0A811UWW3_CERCA|nr:unnamed protein product [Ceratitis capitata]